MSKKVVSLIVLTVFFLNVCTKAQTSDILFKNIALSPLVIPVEDFQQKDLVTINSKLSSIIKRSGNVSDKHISPYVLMVKMNAIPLLDPRGEDYSVSVVTLDFYVGDLLNDTVLLAKRIRQTCPSSENRAAKIEAIDSIMNNPKQLDAFLDSARLMLFGEIPSICNSFMSGLENGLAKREFELVVNANYDFPKNDIQCNMEFNPLVEQAATVFLKYRSFDIAQEYEYFLSQKGMKDKVNEFTKKILLNPYASNRLQTILKEKKYYAEYWGQLNDALNNAMGTISSDKQIEIARKELELKNELLIDSYMQVIGNQDWLGQYY